MYQHVKLMMYYMDAARFAPAIRHSGGAWNGGGSHFPSLSYLLRQVALAHMYGPRMHVIVVSKLFFTPTVPQPYPAVSPHSF
jgi:hypothetical protein